MPRVIEFDTKGRMVLTDGIPFDPPLGPVPLAQLQPGDVLVWYSRNGGRISAAIREFSGGPYSHVGIYVGAGELIDAGPQGVGRVPVTALIAECSYGTVMRYPGLDPQRQSAVVSAACSYVGRGYAWFDAITLPARRRDCWRRWGFLRTTSWAARIGAALVAVRRRWPPSSQNTFCSRMVLEAYGAAGVFPPATVEECTLTPLEFAADGTFNCEGWLCREPTPAWHALDPYSPEPVGPRRWQFSVKRLFQGREDGGQ